MTTIKLTESNYLPWKFQILKTLQGYRLDNFVLSDDESPAKFLPQSGGVESSYTSIEENPTHSAWIRQDHLISSLLLGSMTEEVLQEMLDCSTSREIWKKIEDTYATNNLAKTMSFKNQM